MKKDLIILKIGGSVITDKNSDTPKVDFNNLNRIAKEISEAYIPEKFNLILIHGAGSYGHPYTKKTGIDKGVKTAEQVLAFAEIQRLQNELNCIVTKSLIDNTIPAIPCQASSCAIMKSGRLVKMELDVIKGFLHVGLVPVLYGVPAYDIEQRCSILSGDQIAPFLAKSLGAQKIIHGTNVDGIFTADPNKDKNAKLIPLITEENFEQVKEWLSGSTHIDVTGGMLGKVKEILEVAKLGIQSQFINATVSGNVKKALQGEIFGTIVVKNI